MNSVTKRAKTKCVLNSRMPMKTLLIQMKMTKEMM